MAQVIILSDMTETTTFGHSRYIGPYALTSQLCNAGYDAIVIDYFLKHQNFFDYLDAFLDKNTLVVGISSTFLSPPFEKTDKVLGSDSIKDYFNGHLFFKEGEILEKWLNELRALISKNSPRCKILLGGTKALDSVKHYNHYHEFDYICLGAGDDIIVDFVKNIAEGTEPVTKTVNGMKVLAVSQSKTESIYGCPDARLRTNFAIQKNESLPLEIARGCRYNCKFCHYEKRNSILKNTDILKEELIRNYEMFGTSIYHFADDCFNDRREKVEKVCNVLLSLPFKIEWVSYARADVAVKFPHTADLMVESGARALYFGLESFNDIVAKRAGKGTASADVKNFLLDFRRKYKDICLTQGAFIVGLQGETEESINETIEFVCKNEILDSVSVSVLRISEFDESIDKTVVDFSDYSRDPNKYGFNKISFNPSYWEHEYMNSNQADILAKKFLASWVASHGYGGIRSIFHYPHLRTLGYSHNQIVSIFRSNELTPSFLKDSKKRYQKFLDNYFKDLSAMNSKSSFK